MADNVTLDMGDEPAELSIDDIAARRSAASRETGEEHEQELEDGQEQPSTAEDPAEDDGVAVDEVDELDTSEDDSGPEAKDDVLIKMDDGSTVTVAELKAEAVTLKTENVRISQEVASERRELQQLGAKVQHTFENVVAYLASKLPPEPDEQLIWSDPTRHHQMSYLRASAISELQSLMDASRGLNEVQGQLSETDLRKIRSEEEAKLIAAVPNLKDPARMKSAIDKARSYAKAIGFSDDEFDTTNDARVRRMVIDAAYGASAREAAQKAKAQVKAAVAKGPVQTRSSHPNSLKALAANNAMKRAAQTGNIEDVLAARMARLK